jgi:hypothetical protein
MVPAKCREKVLFASCIRSGTQKVIVQRTGMVCGRKLRTKRSVIISFTPRIRIIKRLKGAQIVERFHSFYVTRNLITVGKTRIFSYFSPVYLPLTNMPNALLTASMLDAYTAPFTHFELIIPITFNE